MPSQFINFNASTPSVIVPPGSLDAWHTAKATLGTTSAQIIVMGDSVFSGCRASNYRSTSWIGLVRAALAAQVPYRGEFIPACLNPTSPFYAAFVGDSGNASQMYWSITTAGTPIHNPYMPFGVWFTGATGANDKMVLDTGVSNGTVTPISFTDYDFHYTRPSASGGSFTLTDDAGTPNVYSLSGNGNVRRIDKTDCTTLAAGPHKLTVTNTGGANAQLCIGGITVYPTGRSTNGWVWCQHTLQGRYADAVASLAHGYVFQPKMEIFGTNSTPAVLGTGNVVTISNGVITACSGGVGFTGGTGYTAGQCFVRITGGGVPDGNQAVIIPTITAGVITGFTVAYGGLPANGGTVALNGWKGAISDWSNPKLLIIGFGGSDYTNNVTLDALMADYTFALTEAQASGCSIVFMVPYFTNTNTSGNGAAYFARVANLASLYNAAMVLLPQIFIKNGGASNLNADGVHPNDAGHVLMANALLSCI